jgi:hypothetical protein
VKAIEIPQAHSQERSSFVETDDGLEAIESIYELAGQYLDGPSMSLKISYSSNYRDFLGSDV